MHTLLKRLSLLIVVITVGLILISCWDDTGSNSTESVNNAPKWTKSEYSDSCERNDTLIIDLLSLVVDPDDDSITISIAEPNDIFGSLNNGFYTIVAPNDTTSGFSVTIIASDGSLGDSSTLNIKFYGDIKINNAPKWSDTSYIYNAIIGESLTIDLSKLSSDVDSNDILSYSILESSTIDTIVDTNYIITPINDSLSPYTVNLIVSDGEKSDTSLFIISLISGNSSPEWNDTIFSYTITKGDLFSLDLSKISTDTDSDKVSYSILGTSSGLDTIIDSIYSVTADSTSISPYTVLLTVSDGKAVDTTKIIFTLLEPNKAPVFTSDKPKVLYEIEEGDSIQIAVEATDPDSSGTVILGVDTLGTLPNPVTATFNSGVFKWKSTLGESGSYVITFFATDGEDTTKTDVTIKVGEANIIPTITVPDSLSNGTARITEGSILTIDFSFNDLDVSDNLTINSKLPSIENLSFITKGDSAATLTFSPNYKTVINDSINVIDSITISVSDGEDEVDFVLIITVINVNRKPVFADNSPANLYTVTSGDTLEIPFSATDADSEDIVLITVDTTTFKTGADITVSGNKIIWNTVFGDIGTDSITLSASDGEDVTIKTIAVIVNENMTTPTITVSATEDTIEITEVDSTGFIVSATPVVQGDVVTLGCTHSLPDSVISFNLSSGEFSFKANYEMATLSNPDTVFVIKFTAIGSGANASMAEYSQFIKVINVNRAPVFTNVPNTQNVGLGNIFSDNIEATDPDGDVLAFTFSVENFNYENGNVVYPVDYTKHIVGGFIDITASVSDGDTSITSDQWRLNIVEHNWVYMMILDSIVDVVAKNKDSIYINIPDFKWVCYNSAGNKLGENTYKSCGANLTSYSTKQYGDVLIQSSYGSMGGGYNILKINGTSIDSIGGYIAYNSAYVGTYVQELDTVICVSGGQIESAKIGTAIYYYEASDKVILRKLDISEPWDTVCTGNFDSYNDIEIASDEGDIVYFLDANDNLYLSSNALNMGDISLSKINGSPDSIKTINSINDSTAWILDNSGNVHFSSHYFKSGKHYKEVIGNDGEKIVKIVISDDKKSTIAVTANHKMYIY